MSYPARAGRILAAAAVALALPAAASAAHRTESPVRSLASDAKLERE